MITLGNKILDRVDKNIKNLVSYFESGGREEAIDLINNYEECLSERRGVDKVLYSHSVIYNPLKCKFMMKGGNDILDSIILFSGKDFISNFSNCPSVEDYVDSKFNKFIDFLYSEDYLNSIYDYDDFKYSEISIYFVNSFSQIINNYGKTYGIITDQYQLFADLYFQYIDEFESYESDEVRIDIMLNIIQDEKIIDDIINYSLNNLKTVDSKLSVLSHLQKFGLTNDPKYISEFFRDYAIDRKCIHLDNKLNMQLLFKKGKELGYSSHIVLLNFDDIDETLNLLGYDYILIDNDVLADPNLETEKLDILIKTGCTFLIDDDQLTNFENLKRETIDPDFLEDDYILFNNFSSDSMLTLLKK